MTDQQEPSGFFSSITPTVWVSLIAAILSLGGVLTVALINAYAQRTLEREQFESNLLLKAIGNDKRQNYENLRFLVEKHFIRRESKKVSALMQDTSFHFNFPEEKPIIKPSSSALSYYTLSTLTNSTFSGIIIDKETLHPIKGATIYITTNRSLRRAIETKTTDYYGRFTLRYPSRNYTLRYICAGYIEKQTFRYIDMKFKEPVILKMQRLIH